MCERILHTCVGGLCTRVGACIRAQGSMIMNADSVCFAVRLSNACYPPLALTRFAQTERFGRAFSQGSLTQNCNESAYHNHSPRARGTASAIIITVPRAHDRNSLCDHNHSPRARDRNCFCDHNHRPRARGTVSARDGLNEPSCEKISKKAC